MVELLLKHGAKGDESDVNSKKATDLATSLGHQDVLSLLAGEKLSKPLKKKQLGMLCKIFVFLRAKLENGKTVSSWAPSPIFRVVLRWV